MRHRDGTGPSDQVRKRQGSTCFYFLISDLVGRTLLSKPKPILITSSPAMHIVCAKASEHTTNMPPNLFMPCCAHFILIDPWSKGNTDTYVVICMYGVLQSASATKHLHAHTPSLFLTHPNYTVPDSQYCCDYPFDLKCFSFSMAMGCPFSHPSPRPVNEI